MRSVLLNLLLLCTMMSQAQTIIENPTFKARSGSISNITKIERSAKDTKLYIHAVFRPGWWIMVEKDHYLQDVLTGKKYPITGAEGITFNKKTSMPKSGIMDFVLIFAPLPKETQTIHWITPNDTEGNFFDISLTTKKKKNNSPILPVRGNWFTNDSQNSWVAGFYDSLAIVHNRMYTYQNIHKKGKRLLLSLKDKSNGTNKDFTLVLQKNGTCTLQQENNAPQTLTQEDRQDKTTAAEADFTDFFRTDTACIQGYIDGYDSRLELKTGMIYMENIITREDYPTAVSIRPDGSFQCKFLLSHPIEKYLLLGNNTIPFYIEPGQTLTIYINWEEILNYSRKRDRYASIENLHYMGASAQASRILGIHDSLLSASFKDKLSTLQKKLTPEEFQCYMQPKFEQWTQITDSLCKLHKDSSKLVHLMRNKLHMKRGCILFEFLLSREFLLRKEPDNKTLQTKEAPSYYQFLKEMPLEDAAVLAATEANIFINRFEYMPPLREKYRNTSTTTLLPDSVRFTYPKKGVLTFLKEKGVKLTPTQEKMRERDELLAGQTVYINPKNLIAEQKLLQDLFRKEEGLIREYTKMAKTEVTEIKKKDIKKETWERAIKDNQAEDSIIASICGKSMPFMWQVAKVRSLKNQLQSLNDRDLAAQYLQQTKSVLTHPFLQAQADWRFENIYPNREETTYQLPEGEPTEVFRRIIRNHPGKVLFVDFWGTFCGPCRAGIEATAELRKQYRNHPEFQFIYITSREDSPEDTYKEYVEKNLKGEASYYIDQSDFYFLRQLFRFNGIPHYELVEKDGSISKKKINTYELKEYLEQRFGTKKQSQDITQEEK